MLERVAPYNINWVKVARIRSKQDKTAIIVNVPGTNDKAHMRVIEYVTADLAHMGMTDLKIFIQSDTEASMKGGAIKGELIAIDPVDAQFLYYDTKEDIILFWMTLFSIPETGFLIVAMMISALRTTMTGTKKKVLVVFTYWTKVTYFVSFYCMSAAIWIVSFPVIPTLREWLERLI